MPMTREEAATICTVYRQGVENPDQTKSRKAWLELWAENSKLIVAYGYGDKPFRGEQHPGKEKIQELIFGKSNILKETKITKEHILIVADEPRAFFWQFHLEIKAKDGAVFDNDLLIKISIDDKKKIKEFLEFGDPRKRGKLIDHLK
jgi:hypothetical protein